MARKKQEAPLTDEELIRRWDLEDGAIIYEDLNSAVIGTDMDREVLVYSYEKLIHAFTGQGMSDEEAIEHIDYNILGGYLGERTPIVIRTVSDDIPW